MSEQIAVILGNVLSGLGMVMLFISTRMQDKKQILCIQSFNHGCSAMAGVLLRGYSGVVQDIVSIARNMAVLRGKLTMVWKVVFVGVGLVLGLAFNNRGVVGLLPIIAATEYAVIVVRDGTTERTLKLAIVVSTICWALYSLFLMNYVNLVANVITCASAVGYLLRKK